METIMSTMLEICAQFLWLKILWDFVSSPQTKCWQDPNKACSVDCFLCLHPFPKWSHPNSVHDFQIYISSLDLVLKLQIPIVNHLLNFCTWKLNITCLTQLLVIFPKPTSLSDPRRSSQQLRNYTKSLDAILTLILLSHAPQTAGQEILLVQPTK